MKAFMVAVIFALAVTACSTMSATPPNVIQLSGAEREQAEAIATMRQQLTLDREKAENEFTRRENDINLAANKLCFDIRKAHDIPANVQYQLDEWGGVLRRESDVEDNTGSGGDARRLHSAALRDGL